MSATYVLGIDVGTTGLKAVALEPELGIVAQAERPHELLSPHPGWAEEEPEQWWGTTVEAVRELLREVPAAEIAAVGVSGMVPAMVLLDSAGKPLRRSIQQNDARSSAEVEQLRAGVDVQQFFAITGGVPNQQNIDPRWRWLSRHEPDIVARTAHLCGSYDYIVYRLTDRFSLEENWAAESGLYDVRAHCWHEPYLRRAGIAPEILPPVRKPADIAGSVSKQAAALTGLRAGTPVVAGSADHVAAALASGLTLGGDLLLKFGGAGDILYVDERGEPDEHFYFDYHDIPGMTLISGCMASSGSLVKWFAREVGGGAALATLDAEAANIPAGSGGIVALPYFLGEKTPIFDPLARGVFAGVMLHHTRAHLYRAVLEAICYGFMHHLTLLQEAGRPIRRICAADGGSRSRLWMQIAANVVGQPVQVVGGEATSALGTAYVAAMGAGLFENWHDIERFIIHGTLYQPQPADVARYQTGFALYRDLYLRLQTLLPQLSALDENDINP